MGTFQGHLLPGAYFIVIGLLWTFNIVRRVIMCRGRNIPFFNTVTYPLPMHRRCVEWPLEAGIKITATGIGMIGELFASTNYGQAGKVVYIGDLQHFTMYAFFCMSGIIDVLHSYRKVPPGIDHAAFAMSFLVEGLLFKYHLHGADELNVLVHSLLLYAIFACAFVSILEVAVKNSVLLAMTRAFVVILQGTWFVHIGLILYPPLFTGLHHWNGKGEHELKIVPLLFTWHIFGVFVLMSLFSAVSYGLHTRVCKPSSEDYMYEMLSSESSDNEESDATEEQVDNVENESNLNVCDELVQLNTSESDEV